MAIDGWNRVNVFPLLKLLLWFTLEQVNYLCSYVHTEVQHHISCLDRCQQIEAVFVFVLLHLFTT